MNIGELKAALVGIPDDVNLVIQATNLVYYSNAQVEESEYYSLEAVDYDTTENEVFLMSEVKP